MEIKIKYIDTKKRKIGGVQQKDKKVRMRMHISGRMQDLFEIGEYVYCVETEDGNMLVMKRENFQKYLASVGLPMEDV
jgi:hypothetical protein